MEFMPPPGTPMHNPQFSPLHPPPHLQHNGGPLIPGSNHHLPFNSHHHSQQHHPHHLMSPPHSQGPLAVDLNNNSLHMYNQPSLMLATPMNPEHAMALSPPQQQQPLASHSSASSEAGPADSESTSPTDCSSSGGESTLSSNHSGSNPNLATSNDSGSIYNGNTTDYNGGSQQATTTAFYHQNGIISDNYDCQKMGGAPMSVNSQYVSLFIV